MEPIDLNHFEKQGFLHGKNIFQDHELCNISNYVIKSYLDEHQSFIQENSQYPHSLLDPFPIDKSLLESAKSNLPPYPHINAPTLIGSPFLKTRISSQVVDIFRSESFIDFASQFFPGSTSYYLHLAPAVRIVYPGNILAYVPDHIDQAYNSHISPRTSNSISKPSTYIGDNPYSFLTFWIPLQGSSATHGGLRLYPGYFLDESPLSKHDTELWIPPLISGDSDYLVPNYDIGDCITFHPNILHGSAPNMSKSIKRLETSNSFRVSLDIRIFPDSSVTTKHYMSLSTGEQFEPGTGPCACLL